jgi:hypothetical protein
MEPICYWIKFFAYNLVLLVIALFVPLLFLLCLLKRVGKIGVFSLGAINWVLKRVGKIGVFSKGAINWVLKRVGKIGVFSLGAIN